MVWCPSCSKEQRSEVDDQTGFSCCTGCGRVLDDQVYSSDPTFTKSATGASQLEGNFVGAFRNPAAFGRLGGLKTGGMGYQSDSLEKTVSKGRGECLDLVVRLNITPKDETVNSAHQLYRLAVLRNFTRGRRTSHVAAACVYIACRQDKLPYLLIDFSDALQTNVFVMGSVFLQLCRKLNLDQTPVISAPVDPSLFIHRFADKLEFGPKKQVVAFTALRLVAAMKRDWIQTGRRPSGICGAAIWLSAHIHGFERSTRDIVREVHVCEATLKKRLVEFENTDSGNLTSAEFELRAKEVESAAHLHSEAIVSSQKQLVVDAQGNTTPMETVCSHKKDGAPHFALGLCRTCYNEFVELSGGIVGGANPPCFKDAQPSSTASGSAVVQQTNSVAQKKRKWAPGMQPLSAVTEEAEAGTSGALSEGTGPSEAAPLPAEEEPESDSLSDIDDSETRRYLLSEQESEARTAVWMDLNADFLEARAAKEEALARVERIREEGVRALTQNPNGASAAEIAAAVVAARSAGNRKSKVSGPIGTKKIPASSAKEAARSLLEKKLSSKVNYAALDDMFADEGHPVQPQAFSVKDDSESALDDPLFR